MVERDLLNLIKNSEEEADKIIEMAYEEVKKLNYNLAIQKEEELKRLNKELQKKVADKKSELEKIFEKDLASLRKENTNKSKKIEEISKEKLPEFSQKMLEKVLSKND